MDLSKIISVAGKSGLFRVIAQGRQAVIAESLLDGKRIPVPSSAKVSSLDEISMFTTGDDVPLKEVLSKLHEVEKGKASTTTLPNDRTFQVTLNDVTSDKRYKVATAISQPDGKSFLKLADITAEANKRFTVGGWAYQKGAIVLLIRIVP